MGHTLGCASMCIEVLAARITAAAPRNVRKRKIGQRREKWVQEYAERGFEGTADATIGFGLSAKDRGTEMQTQLDGVDLDEIEVETKDGGDEEEKNAAGEGKEESVAADDVIVDVVCPSALQIGEWPEDEAADDESEEGDADESPEVEQALMEEGAEARAGVGLVDEESSRDEEEVDEDEERNGGVAETHAGIACGAFVEVKEGFAEGAEVEGG